MPFSEPQDLLSCGNSVIFAVISQDEIVTESSGLHSHLTGIRPRRGSGGQTHAKMKTEIGVILPQAREWPRTARWPRKPGEAPDGLSLCPRKGSAVPTPWTQAWPSGRPESQLLLFPARRVALSDGSSGTQAHILETGVQGTRHQRRCPCVTPFRGASLEDFKRRLVHAEHVGKFYSRKVSAFSAELRRRNGRSLAAVVTGNLSTRSDEGGDLRAAFLLLGHADGALPVGSPPAPPRRGGETTTPVPGAGLRSLLLKARSTQVSTFLALT